MQESFRLVRYLKRQEETYLQALLRSPSFVFGKLDLQIKRRPEVIAPEAAKPALNAYKYHQRRQLFVTYVRLHMTRGYS